MLGSCGPCHSRGYTLLELLIVLALIGLATSLALPSFFKWTRGVEARADENLVVAELAGLPFRAWSSGQPLTLSTETVHAVLRQLPANWNAMIANPIQFSPTGVCSGGEITFIDSGGSEKRFRLAPVTCDVERG